MKTLFLILLLSIIPQQTETVAVIVEDKQPAIIMKKDDAELLYLELLETNKDPKMFKALTVALGKMPHPVFCSLYNLCFSSQQIRHIANN